MTEFTEVTAAVPAVAVYEGKSPSIGEIPFFERLSRIQNELDVPKNQWNKFGKFWYRTAEDIEAAAKPLCAKYGMTLTLSNSALEIGTRFYTRCAATLHDWHSDFWHSVSAYAREDDEKKGMDGSQISGTCSSYARKTALCGLFLIDDEKDSDSPQEKSECAVKPQTSDEEKAIKKHLLAYFGGDKVTAAAEWDKIRSYDGFAANAEWLTWVVANYANG